jgi:hypothetical protein
MRKILAGLLCAAALTGAGCQGEVSRTQSYYCAGKTCPDGWECVERAYLYMMLFMPIYTTASACEPPRQGQAVPSAYYVWSRGMQWLTREQYNALPAPERWVYADGKPVDFDAVYAAHRP